MKQIKYNHKKMFKVKCSGCTHTIDIRFDDIYQKIEVNTEFNDKRENRFFEFDFENDGSIRIYKMDYRSGDSNVHIFPGNKIYID